MWAANDAACTRTPIVESNPFWIFSLNGLMQLQRNQPYTGTSLPQYEYLKFLDFLSKVKVRMGEERLGKRKEGWRLLFLTLQCRRDKGPGMMGGERGSKMSRQRKEISEPKRQL